MLCFRCGSFCPDDSTKCALCGQSFVDSAGELLEQVDRASTSTNMPASIFVVGERASDRYKIVDVLGYGGVGIAYRAKDEELDTAVALKAISPNLMQTETEQKAFQKSMRACRKLHHPNIVRVFDTGVDGSRRFYTMELLDGLSLKKIIKLRHENGESFTAEEIVPIFEQLGSALDYAHRTTWHGNLKPENIVVLPEVLKITDFNLLKALPLKPFLATAKLRTAGYPYLAPELRKESSKLDGSVDIYSLGVILGEMLTGLVFEGHFPKRFTQALEKLPAAVETVFRTAVAEGAKNRYSSAGKMARELEAALRQMPEQGLPAPFGALQSRDEATVSVDMTPPPPPMETDPGSGLSAPPLGLNQSSRDEPTEKISNLGEPTVQEEAPPTISKNIAEQFPELVQDDELTPPPAPANSEEEIISGDPTGDYVFAKEDLANLVPMEETAEGEPVDQPPMSDDEWGDLNPTLAENMSMTQAADVAESPLEPTATLEIDIDAIPDNELALAAVAPPVLPVIENVEQQAPPVQRRAPQPRPEAMPPQQAAQPRSPAPPRNMPPLPQDNGMSLPTLAMGGMAVVAVAAIVFFLMTRSSNEEPPFVVNELVAENPENTETVPADKPGAGSEQVVASETPPAVKEPVVDKRPDDEVAAIQNDEEAAKPVTEDTVSQPTASQTEPATAEQQVALAQPTTTPQPDPVELETPQAPKTQEPAQPEPKVAVADKDLKCPKGMKKISKGGFQFGSESGDPMRNFGEKLTSRRQTHQYCVDYYEYPNNSKKLPKVGVTWNTAKASCESKGKRLCTELEWERACKGPRNLRFPYGNRWNSATCNTEDEEGVPGQLGSARDFKKCKSGYKVYMMSGNAEEWTADSYSSGSSNRVVKGGAANRPDWASRCAARRAQNPRTSATMLGFRCCADPQ